VKRGLAALCFALGSAACGASQLDAHFAPPAAPSQATIVANIARAEPRSERPVAVGISADAAQLCAWDLTTGKLWELPIHAKSAPLVVGDAVVLQEDTGIVVRDLASGKPRTTLDIEGALVGADAVGDALIVSIAHEGGSARGTLAFVAGTDVRWSKTLAQPVGVPALVRNQVLVPWGTQRLSVLAASDGTELARWDFQNLVLGRALVDQGKVYIGQHGLLRVAGDLLDHRYGPLALHAPEKRPLPGQPPVLRDGYARAAAPDSAEHKVRVEWRPAAAEQVALEDELLAFGFYRLVFGLAAQASDVRWVRRLDHDLVGMSKQAGGVFVAEANGRLRFLDASGATRFVRELEKPLTVLTLRPGAFLARGDASAPGAESAALELPEATLHEQLLAAARLDDDRLAPARAMAVTHLARTETPGLTRELIELCTIAQARPGSPSDLGRRAACDALAKREAGGSDVLEALRARGSWLEGIDRPPVGALAQAAARMNLQQAGPLLVSHLESPHTPAGELVPIFVALQSLGYRQAVPQLERFVRLHHAEPAGSELGPALQGALLALGALHGNKVRGTIADVSDDAFTLPAVRQTAKEVLVALDAPTPVRVLEPKKDPKAAEKRVVKDVVVEEVILTDPRPFALDRVAAEKAFRPLNAGLQQCLAADAAQPKSARISMIVSGEGKVEGFLATPTTLQSCVEPILRNAQFPATRLGRQHIVHTVQAVQRTSAPKAPAKGKPSAAGAAPAR
jgi:hypothetical protein